MQAVSIFYGAGPILTEILVRQVRYNRHAKRIGECLADIAHSVFLACTPMPLEFPQRNIFSLADQLSEGTGLQNS